MTPPIFSLASLRETWPMILIITVCVTIELTLVVAGWSQSGGALRQKVYEYAGFWPGLLGRGWQSNYAAQPYTMFLSYGFLHGGLAHLIFNMIAVWQLGRQVIWRVGVGGFWWLYGATLFGGGLGFGLLANSLQPMVGASGALFGLLGGLLAWSYVDRYFHNRRLWPIARAVLILIALNLVMWWLMAGQLAWETHLGGFVVGWIAALIIDPRSREPELDD
jgi:rhomboid protease GluP